jgi:hypothetical protein
MAGCAGKRSSNVLHCPAGPSPAGMSGTIEPRLPINFDRIANAYVKDEHRRNEAKYGRRDT